MKRALSRRRHAGRGTNRAVFRTRHAGSGMKRALSRRRRGRRVVQGMQLPFVQRKGEQLNVPPSRQAPVPVQVSARAIVELSIHAVGLQRVPAG
jgi:hypothetical protein